MRNQTKWVALSLAAILAGGSFSRALRAQSDPRVEGVVPHNIGDADLSILGAPGAAGSGRTTPVVTPGPEADTSAYPIKLDRPPVAGQSYDITISLEQTSKMDITPPGQSTNTNSKHMTVDIAGKLDLVSVDKNNITEFNLALTKFTVDGKDVVPSGKILNGKFDKTYTFTIASGEPLSSDAKDALNSAFEESSDADPFGIDGSKKVGDTWKLDSGLAQKLFEKKTLVVDPANITGTATLKGVESTPEGKALRIEEVISVQNFKTADASQTLDASDVKITANQLLPVNAALPPSEATVTIHMHMHMSAPVTMEMTEDDVRKETIKPAK